MWIQILDLPFVAVGTRITCLISVGELLTVILIFLDGFVPSKNLSYVPNFKKCNTISIGHCPRIKDWK